MHVGAAWALYGRVLDLPFFLDDLAAVELLHPEGPLDGARALRTIWPTDRAYAYHDHFRPLGWASLVLDDAVLGFRPEGFRAVAITLHGLAALLVTLVALRLLGRGPAALGAGLFFAAYAGSSEPVIWVAHRFTLLAAFFFLLALLAAARLAAGAGGVLPVFLASVAALLSKDSQLTEIWALVPFAAAAAPAGRRLRSGIAAAFATALAVAAALAARYGSLGVLLPAFDAGGNVAETFDPLAVVRALPETLLAFLAPAAGSGAEGRLHLVLLLVLGGGLLAVAALDPDRRGVALRASAFLLATLLLAGAPALRIASDLDGSRRAYLPAAALALLLSSAARGSRILVLAGLIAASVAALRTNQEAWIAAGDGIERLVGGIAELDRGGDPVVVTFFPEAPPTLGGVPFVGAGATHLGLYFRPPLRERALHVRAVAAASFVEELERAGGPVVAGVFRRTEASGPGQPVVEPTMSFVAPGPMDPRVGGGFAILRPEAGKAWPDPGAPDGLGAALVLAFPDEPGILDRPVRVRIETDGFGTALYLVPGVQPGVQSSVRDGRLEVAIPYDGIQPLFPAPGTDKLLALLAGTGTPASIRVEELPPPDRRTPPRATDPVAFQLGGGP